MSVSKNEGSGDFKTPRTSQRTNDYMAPWITTMVAPRLPEELLEVLELTSPHTAVRAVHLNWRWGSHFLLLLLPFKQVTSSFRIRDQFEGHLEIIM